MMHSRLFETGGTRNHRQSNVSRNCRMLASSRHTGDYRNAAVLVLA